MKILAIGHKSRVGKDTLANFIITNLRLRTKNLKIGRISFAAKLKENCYSLYKHLGMKDEAFYNRPENESARYVKLPKINKTPVEIWIEYGNKVREVYPFTWIDYGLLADFDIGIVSDLRFPNEVQAVLEKQGILIKLDRTEALRLDSVSDNALNDFQAWHEVYDNNGSLNELNNYAIHLCEKYLL